MKEAKFLLKILSITLLSLFVSLVVGCGGGGSSSVGEGGGGTTPALNGTVSGTAVKGPVSNATVTCFSINADGTKGNMIGTGQTDGQGNYSIPMGDYSGPVLCQMTGGNYMDEATGINMPMLQNDVMTCVIPSMSAGSTVSGIHMTPLTSMAQMMAQNMPGSMTSLNITAANNAVGQHFNTDDILHTPPMNTAVNGAGLGASQYMKNYGMTIAAMSKYANMIGMTGSSGIVTAMMNDASDGYMNGMMGTSGIMMGGGMMGGTMMSPNAGTSGLANAMTQFIQSPMNKSGVTVQEMTVLINKLSTSSGVIQ